VIKNMANVEMMLLTLGIAALSLIIYMLVAFIVGSVKKNNGLIDIFYGPGYFVFSFTCFITIFLLKGSISVQNIIMTVLVFVWAIRLASYVYIRNHGKPEDYRYAAMRERWKTNILLKSLIRVYLFQGFVIFVVDIPSWFVIISDNPPITNPLDFYGVTLWLGLFIWTVGFFFESIGDWSLYNFLKKPDNKGKIMDKGLWRYTQHPNYFGEVTQWWGLFIIALGTPFGFITFIGPAYITLMIIKVSGVRLLDRRFEGDGEYNAYKQRTSAFLPWFPKKERD
jgi:steroid 5-alpha reductase family enzyme